MTRFLVLFVILVSGLFFVEKLQPVQTFAIEPWTHLLASKSAAILTTFDDQVLSQGRVLFDPNSGFGVSIEAGCNGVEAALILIAAILAFPSSWRLKFFGVAAGIAAIQAANLLRVISLYYLGQWNLDWFHFAHLYFWQALIMLDVLAVWLLWVRAVHREQRSQSQRFAGAGNSQGPILAKDQPIANVQTVRAEAMGPSGGVQGMGLGGQPARTLISDSADLSHGRQ